MYNMYDNNTLVKYIQMSIFHPLVVLLEILKITLINLTIFTQNIYR